MSSSERRKVVFTEQDEIDAARLLAVLEQRSKQKRLAGGLVGEPAEIRDPAPTVLEKRPEASKRVGVIAQASGQYATGGVDGSDHIADEAGNGWVAGGVSGLLRARIDFAMRPPAQPCAGSNGEGFTVEAEARNVHTAKK